MLYVKTKQADLVSSILSKKELDADGERDPGCDDRREFKKSWA